MHSRDVMLLQNNISRNYHYCDQDDTFPWVCVLKYVSNSNRCHRHLEFYIFDVQKFPYLSKYKYHIFNIGRQPLASFIWSFLLVVLRILNPTGLLSFSATHSLRPSFFPSSLIARMCGVTRLIAELRGDQKHS